ncbi:MAG: rhodanese-like domain-containing protein [Ginsengibacter sp.]
MKTITSHEIKKRKDEGEELNLVDVREPAEVAEFNIGGINLPIKKIQGMETEEIDDLKDKEVICYCRSGQRSMMACLVLEQMGFTNVKNLEGGVLAWKENYDDEA